MDAGALKTVECGSAVKSAGSNELRTLEWTLYYNTMYECDYWSELWVAGVCVKWHNQWLTAKKGLVLWSIWSDQCPPTSVSAFSLAAFSLSSNDESFWFSVFKWPNSIVLFRVYCLRASSFSCYNRHNNKWHLTTCININCKGIYRILMKHRTWRKFQR